MELISSRSPLLGKNGLCILHPSQGGQISCCCQAHICNWSSGGNEYTRMPDHYLAIMRLSYFNLISLYLWNDMFTKKKKKRKKTTFTILSYRIIQLVVLKTGKISYGFSGTMPTKIPPGLSEDGMCSSSVPYGGCGL